MQDFKKLIVWEKSHLLTLNIYQLTKTFPKEELFGLTSQIRRSSVSIPANIAEGTGKLTSKDVTRYFQIALGSLQETEYYLILSKDLNLLKIEDFTQLNDLLNEVKAMLITLIQRNRVYEDPENYG